VTCNRGPIAPLTLKFKAELNMRRNEVLRSLEKVLLSPCSFLGKGVTGPCEMAKLWVGNYLSNLCCYGILPTSSAFQTNSCLGIVGCVREVMRRTGQIVSGKCVCNLCSNGGEGKLSYSISSQLTRILESGRGVCLDCVTSGQRSKIEGRCRYRHE
jgi:hypothetical protein